MPPISRLTLTKVSSSIWFVFWLLILRSGNKNISHSFYSIWLSEESCALVFKLSLRVYNSLVVRGCYALA